MNARYNSLYISLPSGKQQLEINKESVHYGSHFLNLYVKFITASQIQFCDSFGNDKQSK